MDKFKRLLLVVGALSLLAFITATVPDPFDAEDEINSANLVRAGYSNQYPRGTYLLAEFSNQMMAFFFKQSPMSTILWRQVGPGWSTGEQPPSEVCDEDASVPGCQPPGSTSASTLFLGCHQPGCALWRFSYSASGATKYRIQSSSFSFGPWSTWAVTSSTTYFPHLAQNPLYFRIRGENSAGVGPYKKFYVPGQCGGGGGPID